MRKSVKVKFNVLKINENKKKRLREQNLNIMIYYLLILGILFQRKLNIEKRRNVYSVYERNLLEKEKNEIKKKKTLYPKQERVSYNRHIILLCTQ